MRESAAFRLQYGHQSCLGPLLTTEDETNWGPNQNVAQQRQVETSSCPDHMCMRFFFFPLKRVMDQIHSYLGLQLLLLFSLLINLIIDQLIGYLVYKMFKKQ